MRNLLSAGTYRLLKGKLLYVGFVAMIIMELVSIQSGMGDILSRDLGLEESFFFFSQMIPFIMAAFCGLFLGADYSDGTLRNKLISGHTKAQIYLANLAISSLVSLAFSATAVVAGLLSGLANGIGFQMEAKELFWYLACAAGVAVAAASLGVLISMLITNRSVAIVTVMVLTLLLSMIGHGIITALNQPEMIPQIAKHEVVMGDQTDTIYGPDPSLPEVPNPGYPQGALRTAYQILTRFLPAAQALQLSFLSVEEPWQLLAGSGLFILVTTTAGMAIFRKKNIR